MNQDRDAPLEPWQFAVPVRWFVRSPATFTHVPDEALTPAFGPGTSRKIKSWAHEDDGVHWLATRGGTPYHTDPNYLRFTHHLLVRNDGWRIRGKDDEYHPVMRPGCMYCLDTHSPHEVVRDDRLVFEKPGFKLQIAVDSDTILNPDVVWKLLAPWVRRDPAETSATATRMAPRPRKKEPAHAS